MTGSKHINLHEFLLVLANPIGLYTINNTKNQFTWKLPWWSPTLSLAAWRLLRYSCEIPVFENTATQVNRLRIYSSMGTLLHCRINDVHKLAETQAFLITPFFILWELMNHTSIELKKRGGQLYDNSIRVRFNNCNWELNLVPGIC